MHAVPESVRPARRAARPASWKRRLTLGILGIIALAGGSTWWLSQTDAAHEDKATGGTSSDGDAVSAQATSPTRVDVVHPRSGGLVRQTIQPGSIHAFESVDLFAKVSGFLKTQAVDIGDAVKRGDVLATIEATELEKDVEEASAAVEQARARAALAEARLATAEAERDATAAMLTQAEAEIGRYVADRTLSEKQLERVKGLHSRNALAKEVVDEHEHSLESSRAAERAARAAVLTSRAQLNASAAKVQQARADIAEARTAIRLAEARAGRAGVINNYTQIVAPFDGVITARHSFPGDFIRSATEGGAVPLLTVQRTDRLRVVIQVPDSDVSLLDVGDPATIIVDALKGRSFSGTVSRRARAEDSTTRTMRVEVDLENPSGLLCEGMYGRATIMLRPPSKGLSIPARCIVGHSTAGQAKVYLVRDARVRPASVILGDDDGLTTEVLSGLGPDDSVVLNPRAVPDDSTAVVANLVPAADLPH